MKYRIGIIGSGMNGEGVGRNLIRGGHEVLFSSRHPEKLKALGDETGARVGTPQEAVEFGEWILLATPYKAHLGLAGSIQGWEGKILLDATNPYPQRDGQMAQDVIDDPNQSSTGHVATIFDASRVVKVFNAIYFPFLRDLAFQSGDERLAIPIAGDDVEARELVGALLDELGYWPLDFGGLANSGVFEPGGPFYNKNLRKPEAEQLYAELKG